MRVDEKIRETHLVLISRALVSFATRVRRVQCYDVCGDGDDEDAENVKIIKIITKLMLVMRRIMMKK